MKITLAYIPEEESAASIVVADLQRKHPGAKVRRSDRHPPFKHIYLSTEKPCGSRDSACKSAPDMV